MCVYVLCFDPPYQVITETGRVQRARHYIGYTSRSAEQRLADHLACNGSGSPLVAAVVKLGGKVDLVKQWKCGTRGFERYLKNGGNAMRWCPRCGDRSRRMPTFAKWYRSQIGMPKPPRRRSRYRCYGPDVSEPVAPRPVPEYVYGDEEIPF